MAKYITISAESIIKNPANFYHITSEMIENRKKSLEECGLRNKLKVTNHTEVGKYLLYSGHCNLAASLELGKKEFEVEYTEFSSREEMLEALMVENESRTKNSCDIANEIKLWKQLWGKKQGSRSDIKGDAPTNTRKRLTEKFRITESQIDIYLNILEKRKSLFDQLDMKHISLNGADNIIKYLEKRDQLAIPDKDMMDSVISSDPVISKQLKDGEISFPQAFRLAAKKLRKILDSPANDSEETPPTEEEQTNTENSPKAPGPKKKGKKDKKEVPDTLYVKDKVTGNYIPYKCSHAYCSFKNLKS